jgi:autotransporter-associated beta strand protein
VNSRPLTPAFLAPLAFSILPLPQAAAQTTYSWRSEATTGNWNLADNWWDGVQTALPAGNEILQFANDVQPSMTNDLAATTRHRIMFTSGATVARTIAGTTANAFEPMSGNGPLIQNDSTGAHAINFPITIDTQNLTINTAAGPLSIGGAISGSQGLDKQGTGVLTLSATNSYAGKTSITAGAISVDGDNRLGSEPGAAVADQLSLSGGGALRATGTATITFSTNRGITLGTGGGALESNSMATNLNANFPMKVTGTGPLALRANGNTSDTGGSVGGNLGLTNTANDFTGDVTIHSGVVNFGSDGSFGATTNDIILAGGGLVATAARTLPATRDIVLSGGGDRIFRVYGGITFTINGAITGTGNVRHTDGGTLALAGANTFTGNVISAGGAGRIIALSGNNSYTGVTHIVNGSTVRLDANNTVPDTSSVLMYANGVFNANGKTDTVRGLFVGSAGDSNSTVNLGGAGSTGTLTIANNSMPAGSPTNIGDAFHSKLTGIGTIEYKHTTSDTAIWNWLNTTNDFTGNIVISRGRLRSALNAGAGVWGNVDNDIVFNGDVVATLSNGLGTASLQGNASGALVFPATRSIILNSGKEGTFYVWGGNTYTIDGQVTGAGNLRKEDGGILLLNNVTNNYSGLTRIAQGTLRVGAVGAVSDSSGVEIAGGTFDTNLLDESVASLTGTGGNVGGGGTLTVLTSGSASYSGAINGASTLRMAGTGTQTISGTGDNVNGWARVDSGTLVLGKTSTSGVHSVGRTNAVGLTITGGTAQIGGSGGDQIYSETHVHQTGGFFDLNGSNEAFRALTGTAGTVHNSASATISELTVGQGSVALDSYAYAGSLTDGSGQLKLTKTGLGTQALSGTSSHTGLTSVAEGRLLVNGTFSASNVSVGSGAVLGGTGTVTGTVSVGVGGTVAPGASTGTLTAGTGLIDGNLQVELDGASADRLTVTGELNITNANLVIDTPGAGATEAVYIIASYGTLTGTDFASTSPLPDGYALDYNYQGNKQIALVGSATPYQSWANTSGLDNSNDDPADDPDKDGQTNLEEFAFDGDPLSGEASGKIVSAISQIGPDKVLTLTLPVRTGADFNGDGDLASDPIAGLIYKIQGSIDLSDFITMNITEVTPAIVPPGTPTLSSGQWTYRTFRVPTAVPGAAKQFLRAVAE